MGINARTGRQVAFARGGCLTFGTVQTPRRGVCPFVDKKQANGIIAQRAVQAIYHTLADFGLVEGGVKFSAQPQQSGLSHSLGGHSRQQPLPLCFRLHALADFVGQLLVGPFELDIGFRQIGRALCHPLLQGAHQPVNAASHGIKALGKLAKLIAAVDLGTHLQVAPSQFTGGFGQPDHVARDATVERQADRASQCHRCQHSHHQQCGRQPAGPGDLLAGTLSFGVRQRDQVCRNGINGLGLQVKLVQLMAEIHIEQHDLVGHRQVVIEIIQRPGLFFSRQIRRGANRLAQQLSHVQGRLHVGSLARDQIVFFVGLHFPVQEQQRGTAGRFQLALQQF